MMQWRNIDLFIRKQYRKAKEIDALFPLVLLVLFTSVVCTIQFLIPIALQIYFTAFVLSIGGLGYLIYRDVKKKGLYHYIPALKSILFERYCLG